MKFDLTWDDVKRQTTLIDRGIDFADAESVFAGPVFEFEDMRRDIMASDAWFALACWLAV